MRPACLEDEVVRIGAEVGLTRDDVREALAEFRSGVLERPGALRSLLRQEVVRAAREVPRPPAEVAAALDNFMVGGQLLHPVRRTPLRMQYRPAIDWMSKVARAASASARRHYVSAAERVEVKLQPAGQGGTFVEIEVDPKVCGAYRGWVVTAAVTGGIGIGAGITALVLEAMLVPVVAVVGGVVAWSGLTWAVARVAGRAHLKRLSEVQTELEGILDRLEGGDQLEPPPPSWRRWVQRHFHGVSKELRLRGPSIKPGGRTK